MTVKLVIFDLDGTLADAYQAITASFNHTMRVLGYPSVAASVIRRAVGWGDRNLLRPFVRSGDLERALTLYRRHHAVALRSGVRLLPGVRKVILRLKKRGYRLAVASNRPTRFSLILMKHLGLRGAFDYVLCADRLRYRKPHPQIINRILRRFRLKPSEAAFVGDMVIDAQAGRRAGVMTVIVTTGSHRRQEIKEQGRPDFIIRSLEGLLDIV